MNRTLCILLSFAIAASPAFCATHWVATWTAAPVSGPAAKTDSGATTLREIAHLSLGGSQLRIQLSNQFGDTPLTIGAATIALSSGSGAVDASTLRALNFSGTPTTVIAPGATVISDPVDLTVAPLSNVAVSLFLPAQKIGHITEHSGSRQTNYEASGNRTMAASMPGAKTLTPWRFLTAIDVQAPASDAAIVAFGDSITDGTGSTVDANMRWPNLLAARLQATPGYSNFAVDDEGIGGNRILNFGTGPSALARWKQDALDVDGAKYIILLESINDIGHSSLAKEPNSKFAGQPTITADDLINAMKSLIAQAHARGIKVIGATLTPYQGAKYERPDGELIRAQVNAFIRTGGVFDGVVDFDAATHDPANPKAYIPAYNDRDHLHPNDTGYKAMVNSINLSLFK